jgi:secondary thiamine-phosphate synthase enzyme
MPVETTGQGLYDVTPALAAWLAAQTVRQGLLNLFLQHTSASLVIQENADPDVLRDLAAFFRRLVPEDARLYRHDAEGPDDMPAHIRSVLTQTQLGIPVIDGSLALGIWQGVYLFEHRHAPHRRALLLTLIGD